jgi:hypothetical protein
VADERAKEVVADWEHQNGERSTFMWHWQQVANYTLPNRADYLIERTPGQKRMQYIYSSAPLSAIDEAAAGFHGNLTSPFLLWFYLEPDDEAMNRNQEIRAWFDAATLAMYRYFNGPRHNFASQSYEYYLDLVSIGSATMAVGDSADNDIVFSTRHMKECCWAESDEDRIDRMSRRFQWTAKQAVQRWGERAGEKPNKAYTDGKFADKFWFHHRVVPRLKRDKQRADSRNMAFESLYVSEADQTIIDEGGFPEFPYLAGRFAKASGETYGRGPGMLALPDIKMLNEFVKLLWRHGQKVVAPPLMLPDDGFLLPIQTGPDSLNYFRAGTRPTDRIAPIPVGGDMKIGLDLLNALVMQINRSFHLDLFRMPVDPRDPAASGKGVTATFTNKIDSDGMRILSPMLARLQSEFLEPLITRTFAILWRKSVAARFDTEKGSPFPAPPDVLSRVRWHAEYVSPIAVAQKSSRLDVIARLMEKQLALKQMDPNAPMILDPEAIMRLSASDMHAPAEALKTPQRLVAEAQALAQQVQQQHEAQIAEQGSAALVNLAQVRSQMQGRAGERIAGMREAA